MCNKLSKISTYDLVIELQERSNVEFVINDRSSSTSVICAGRNEPRVIEGECIVLIINELF